MTNDSCPICLMKLQKNIGCIVPCGHCIHVKCFHEYVHSHNLKLMHALESNNTLDVDDYEDVNYVPTCPTCRTPILNFQRLFLEIDSKGSVDVDGAESACMQIDEETDSRRFSNQDDTQDTILQENEAGKFDKSSTNNTTSQAIPFKHPMTPNEIYLTNLLKVSFEQSMRISMIQHQTMLIQNQVNRAQRQIIEHALLDSMQDDDDL